MQPGRYSHHDPLMSAAQRALETGNADHIVIWIPEGSENTLKNLLEKAYCEHGTKKNAHNHTVDWYFRTVDQLFSAYSRSHNLNISTKTPEDKKVLQLVAEACESGNFEEITTIIHDTSGGELRQRFDDVLMKKNFNPDDIAAGRLYVSAFTGLMAFVNTHRPGSC